MPKKRCEPEDIVVGHGQLAVHLSQGLSPGGDFRGS